MRPTRRTLLRAAAAAALLLAARPALAQDGWEWSGAVPRGGTLKLYTSNGDIDVESTGGGTARVTGRVSGEGGDRIRFETVRDGDNVVVCAMRGERARCTAEGIREERSSSRGWNRQRRGHLVVALPRGVDVRAASGNGDVSVEGVGGSVAAVSGNGDVRVSGTASEVRATTGNGDVRVSDVDGAVTATSGNGRVEVGSTRGPVRAATGNGDVLVRMERTVGSGDVRLSSGNGSVRLEVPASFSGRLDASSGSGDIDAEVPVRLQGRANRFRLTGALGDGEGPNVRLSTGSGRVVVARAN